MGIWDEAEYMNEVNWPEKKLKQGYQIGMCFLYPDEDEENRYMWCCGIFTRVKRSNDRMIKVDIKWEESFIDCGESDLTAEILKNTCGIRRRQKICVEAECTAILDNN